MRLICGGVQHGTKMAADDDFVDDEEFTININQPNLRILNAKIGPSQFELRIRYDLLMAKAPGLKHLLNGPDYSRKGDEATLKLPFEDAVALSLFSSWLYLGRLQPINMIFYSPFYGAVFDHLRLYFFAERHELINLMDYTMSFLLATWEKYEKLPSLQNVFYTYNNSPRGSLLRMFMCRSLYYVLKGSEQHAEWNFPEPVNVLQTHKDIPHDVGGIKDKVPEHPLDDVYCRYHAHGLVDKNYICPYKYASDIRLD